jgi:hypothetical protein
MVDTGAELTEINRMTFDNKENPILLREYSGPRLCSVDGKLNVLGAINLNKCTIATDCTIFNAKMIVLDKIQQYDCLLGRDLIRRIPFLHRPTQSTKAIIEARSAELIANLNSLLERHTDAEGERPGASSYEEGEIVIFPGFTDNKPTTLAYKADLAAKTDHLATQPEVTAVRALIHQELNGIAADKVQDINLEANRHMEFHIKLIDTHTRPIRSKSRPIPHSLKEPVRTAIFKQLNAGLIRHSSVML